MKFYKWSNEVNLFNLKCEDFPEINKLNFFNFVKKLNSGYIMLHLKIKNLNYNGFDKNDLVKWAGCFIF